jgi:OOP family OmpA-OmpF porin
LEIQIMNTMSRSLLGLVLTAASLPAFAQQTETRPYVSVMYDTVFADDDRNADSSRGGSIGFGAAINNHWGVEVGGFYDKAKSDGSAAGSTWKEYGGKVDGMFFFSRNPGFSPYTAIGVGGMENKNVTTNNSSFNVFVDAGLGFFKYFPIGSYDIAFRADARYRWVDAKDIPGAHSFGEPVVRVGLVFPFGKRSSAAAAAAGGGAAAAAAANAGKGGNAGDADQNRAFESVYFDFDRSDLNDGAKAKLDNTAGAINGLTQKYPALKVDLSGNTDWIGTEGYNQSLSERRADTVKQYLTRKGVAADRITTHAYGETKPVAPNDTAEGRALNRRVEVKTDAPKK